MRKWERGREVIKRKTKKKPEEVKSKDGVIRRNLDRIRVSGIESKRDEREEKAQIKMNKENCERNKDVGKNPDR